jgi:hypothetical protein
VFQLWDFFLAQSSTILITLAASIIIHRVEAIKGPLHDQLSLLSAAPAVDILRCKVPSKAHVPVISPDLSSSLCFPRTSL